MMPTQSPWRPHLTAWLTAPLTTCVTSDKSTSLKNLLSNRGTWTETAEVPTGALGLPPGDGFRRSSRRPPSRHQRRWDEALKRPRRHFCWDRARQSGTIWHHRRV